MTTTTTVTWRNRLAWIGIMLLVLGSGCSSSSDLEPQLPRGRCTFNEDCPAGNRCVNTYCEDIYHPRKYIKQR